MKSLDSWAIINENPAHWNLENGVLTIQVQQGNIWGAGSSMVDNVFMHDAQGDYSIETDVELLPELAYEQAGIGIFWDIDNYIKISREKFNGEQALVFVTEMNGSPAINQLIAYPQAKASIKLVKRDNQVTAYYKPDPESDWVAIRTVTALSGSEQGIMLYTFSGSPAQPRFATFTNTTLLSL